MKTPSAFQVYLLLPFMVLISLWTTSGRWFLNGNIRALVFLLIMTLTHPTGSQYGAINTYSVKRLALQMETSQVIPPAQWETKHFIN